MDIGTEPLLGWRGWYAKPGEAVLRSLTWSYIQWPLCEKIVANCQPRGFESRCSDGSPPSERCVCGIYAYKREFKARKWLREQPPASFGPAGQLRVMGQISLWGRVLRAENGYRAQFAYPYSLEVVDRQVVALSIPAYEQLLAGLSRNYRVEVMGTP